MSIAILPAGPTCADTDGLPRLWSTVWAQWLPLNQSRKTLIRKMRAADFVYDVSDELHGRRSLDRFLCEADVASLNSVLSAVFFRLRNRAVRTNKSMGTQFDDAMRFIVDILERHHDDDAGDAVRNALKQLAYRYRDTKLDVNAGPPQIRALPEVVIADLFDIFNPLSGRNPFRTTALKWRNFMIFLLLLESGIRRGEAALLTSRSLLAQFDSRRDRHSFWLNIRQTADEDERYEAPSLKTVDATRQIPVSSVLAALIQLYEIEYRHESYSEFLLASQKSKPLSVRQMNQVMEVATRALGESAKAIMADRGLKSVSCHELRHSCACRRLRGHLDGGMPLPTALTKLQDYFGWSLQSNMPLYYSRAEFEPQAEETWSQVMDAATAVLRQVGIHVSEAPDA